MVSLTNVLALLSVTAALVSSASADPAYEGSWKTKNINFRDNQPTAKPATPSPNSVRPSTNPGTLGPNTIKPTSNPSTPGPNSVKPSTNPTTLSPNSTKPAGEETKSLTQLYDEAVKEGGRLVVYHGGDTPNQQDSVINAFRQAYPKVNLTLIVDYSKYHNARIDNQLETDSLVPDVVALQTLQDYPRWKREGKLMAYKPAGASQVYDGFADPDGAWTSHAVYTFSYFYDEAQLSAKGLPAPKTAQDLADPKYRDLIASAYPHDDDATLYVYDQWIKAYGWDWVRRMAEQKIEFRRGSDSPAEAVTERRKAIGVAGAAPFNASTVRVRIGRNETSDYLAWGQRIAILKKAPHPAAAKLFLNWILSREVQTTVMEGFSSRKDVASEYEQATGEAQPWNVPRAGSLAFQKFMEDRAGLEELRAKLAIYFGEVRGEPTPGQLGLHPGRA
ncbi:hypothetical protein PINS_up006904 [Pythium insidiosum]|nr:hypothetical protein PINS_up006904 [Pythium insidiosum]